VNVGGYGRSMDSSYGNMQMYGGGAPSGQCGPCGQQSGYRF